LTAFTCTSCNYPLQLYNSTCISQCPSGYFSLAISNQILQCTLCSIQCKTCDNSTYCTSCNSAYLFYNNTCLYSCPLSTFSSNLTTNNISSMVCLVCSSNCLTCVSVAQCEQCQQGYYLTSTQNGITCTSDCASGMFLSGNTCFNCSQNCLNCLSNTICLACSISNSLSNNSCVSSCPSGSISILMTVSIPSSNTSSYVCKLCNTVYQNCQLCANNSCSLCETGYILNYDKSCVIICSTGYLNITNQCVLCNSQCQGCVNLLSNCTQCVSGYFFYQNTTTSINSCLQQCPYGTTSISSSCQSCLSPCATCNLSLTSCLTCKTGFLLLII